MSGPVSVDDALPEGGSGRPAQATVEIGVSRHAQVGSVPVRRALPRKERRTVWGLVLRRSHGPDIGHRRPGNGRRPSLIPTSDCKQSPGCSPVRPFTETTSALSRSSDQGSST
jgi:hypothetical protein